MRMFAKLGLCLAIASTSTITMADVIFNGTTVPSTDITSISIDPDTGNVLINATSDWAVSQDTGEPEPPPPPPPPPPLPSDQLAVSLVASVAEIDQWQEVTFSWQSVDAVRCVTRLGTPEWAAVSVDPLDSGSATIEMTEFGTDIPFRMFCFDAAGEQVAAQVSITVNEAQQPAPEPETTPTVSCDTPDVSRGDIVEWAEMYQAATFPDTSRLGDTFSINRNSYVSIKFNTGNSVGTASNRAVAISGGIRNVAVSQCPGMFVTDIPDACKQAQGTGSVHRFSTDGSLPCNLEANTDYYFNITYADVNDRITDDTSYCGSNNCTVKLETFLSFD